MSARKKTGAPIVMTAEPPLTRNLLRLEPTVMAGVVLAPAMIGGSTSR